MIDQLKCDDMSLDAHFKDFVERQLRAVPGEDAGPKRDAWLGALRRLYDRLSGYLGEYIESGAIELRETSIDLNEEQIGVYAAPRLAIAIGAQEIALIPVGTMLIGSRGRVDVDGSAGTSRLVLVDPAISRAKARAIPGTNMAETREDCWKISSRPPLSQLVDLNKETFLEMLMEVSNG